MAEPLYQDLLLKHHKAPIGFELSGEFTHSAEGENGGCGDEIFIKAVLSDVCIERISFSGDSCAICRASASILCQLTDGKPKQEVLQLISTVTEFLAVDLPSEQEHSILTIDSDLQALSSVRQYPVRLQCAQLPWNTLKQLVDNW